MKWTYENCKKEAMKYKTKTEFFKKSPGAYDAAWNNKWLNDFFSRDKHTFDECKKESMKYNKRSEFAKKSFSFYWVSKKNNWLDIFFDKINEKPNKYWTYDKCTEESKKYKSRIEFCNGSPGAYYKSTRKKWIDDFTWLKTPILYDKLEEKNNIIYAYIDDVDRTVYVGRTINLKRRHIQHNNLNRSGGKYDSIKQHFVNKKEELPFPIILEENLTYEQSQDREDFWKNKYISDGWNVINKAKTGKGSSSLGRVYLKWTYDVCKREASKYTKKYHFKKGCKGAYEASIRNKWINDFFTK